MKQVEIISSALEKLSTNWKRQHLLIGFDGFVDEIIHIVDERKNSQEYKRIPTIKDFAKRIADAAGLSANIELVPTQIKLGGNGPIMANALIEQGYEVTYIGALGKEEIHPVFREFASSCKNVISLTDPAHTEALEFFDGKLLLGKVSSLVDVSWDSLSKLIPQEELKALLSSSSLIAFTDWTLLPEMNSILKGFYQYIAESPEKPGVFIDLADPKKRTKDDIRGILRLIQTMEENARVIFGMNTNESSIIASILSIDESDITLRAAKIREKLNISLVVIHPTNGAAVASKGEACWVDGPYTSKPMLTTGAGDNFNSGFCNGWLTGMTPAECLAVGVCTSGYYVRNCYSPNRSELIQFMEDWLAK
ncbi:MAG: hypothetical protein J7L53_10640 [Deltaproteobacteria bacterium]|nr:hypothetical protein [Deltaproteobacteria bacterium]